MLGNSGAGVLPHEWVLVGSCGDNVAAGPQEPGKESVRDE